MNVKDFIRPEVLKPNKRFKRNGLLDGDKPERLNFIDSLRLFNLNVNVFNEIEILLDNVERKKLTKLVELLYYFHVDNNVITNIYDEIIEKNKAVI
jgi:hypothetical protein